MEFNKGFGQNLHHSNVAFTDHNFHDVKEVPRGPSNL